MGSLFIARVYILGKQNDESRSNAAVNVSLVVPPLNFVVKL